MWAFNELEHFLLSPEDDAISIPSFAENDCVEGGRKKFAVLEPKRGTKVSQTGRFFEALHEDQGVAANHRVHEREAEQAFGDNGAKAKIDQRRMKFREDSARTSWSWKTRSRRWKMSCSRQVKK